METSSSQFAGKQEAEGMPKGEEAREEARRYTISVTPLTSNEWQHWLNDLRYRFGRKHLVHVLAAQPSNTHLDDAPGQWHKFDKDDPSTWPKEIGTWVWITGGNFPLHPTMWTDQFDRLPPWESGVKWMPIEVPEPPS